MATVDINATTTDPLQLLGTTYFQRNDVGPKTKIVYKDVAVKLTAIGGGGAKDPFRSQAAGFSLGAALPTDPLYIGGYDVIRVKQILKRDDENFTTANYLTGSTDVTNEFNVFKGPRDNYYDWSYIQLKPSSTLNINSSDTRLLVILDYFEHDESTGLSYMTIDSYPIDDSNPSATNTINKNCL